MNLDNSINKNVRGLVVTFILACLFLALTENAKAQNIAINTDESKADPNAILDIKSSTKGLLIPRMTTAQRIRIPQTNGLMVYDVTTKSFWYSDGESWKNMSTDLTVVTSDAWLLTGNAGTVDGTNFIGTTDNVPFNIRVNNQKSGRIDGTLFNTFLGFTSGFNNTTGNDNTGIGASALFGITTGYNNTAIGSNALQSNSTGFHNAAFGRFALMSNTTGYNNAANGTGALFSNTTGIHNTAAGADAMYNNITGSRNTGIGHQALYSNFDLDGQTAIGYGALYSNQFGPLNTATGFMTMYNNSSGHSNTANGYQSMFSNIGGIANTGSGSFSLYHNTEGWGNSAHGADALVYNTDGIWNTSVGSASSYFSYAGSYNTVVGASALFGNGAGNRNTAIGVLAMASNSNGDGNTAVGANADVSSGDFINATALGSTAIVNASNKVRIGNAAVTVIEGQVPFTTPSDGRFKNQVQEDVKGLDFILQLHPVTYQFDTKRFDAQLRAENGASSKSTPDADKWLAGRKQGKSDPAMEAAYTAASSIRRSGFIAQEVEVAATKSGYNFSGIIKPKTEQEHYGLSYESFVVPLVKAMQEQQELINAQSKKITELQQQNKRMEEQDKKINLLILELEQLKKKFSH